MSQISLGEDILGILLAVMLISTFIVVLENSYSRHQKHRKEFKNNNKILRLSDLINYEAIKDNEYPPRPGIIQKRYLEELENVNEFLNFHSKIIRVKISSIAKRKTLAAIGKNNEEYNQSLSLPIIFETRNSRIPARMIVQMG